MRFLGLVASQGGLFHLPENMFLKKSVAKVLQKSVTRKVPSPERRINAELLGTSKPKGTIPTRSIRSFTKLFCLVNILFLCR